MSNPDAATFDRLFPPKPTKYRIWWIPQLGCGATFHEDVPNLTTGKILLNALARYDLFQLANRIKPDYANAGGLQYFDTSANEWFDWDTEDGYGIDETSLEQCEELDRKGYTPA